MALQVGVKAPDFKAKDQNGKLYSLSDLKGKTTLMYFYPKDETPGCTAQACSLRDNYEALQAEGVGVIGVSKDDVESHKKFADHHKLPFVILADPEHTIIEAYGAWGERSLYGRKFFGTIRSGALIGPDLTILAVWPKLPPLKTVSLVEKWLAGNQ